MLTHLSILSLLTAISVPIHSPPFFFMSSYLFLPISSLLIFSLLISYHIISALLCSPVLFSWILLTSELVRWNSFLCFTVSFMSFTFLNPQPPTPTSLMLSCLKYSPSYIITPSPSLFWCTIWPCPVYLHCPSSPFLRSPRFAPHVSYPHILSCPILFSYLFLYFPSYCPPSLIPLLPPLSGGPW